MEEKPSEADMKLTQLTQAPAKPQHKAERVSHWHLLSHEAESKQS